MEPLGGKTSLSPKSREPASKHCKMCLNTYLMHLLSSFEILTPLPPLFCKGFVLDPLGFGESAVFHRGPRMAFRGIDNERYPPRGGHLRFTVAGAVHLMGAQLVRVVGWVGVSLVVTTRSSVSKNTLLWECQLSLKNTTGPLGKCIVSNAHSAYE